jgi:hypothetical protein
MGAQRRCASGVTSRLRVCELWVTGCVIPRDNFETSFLQVISRRLKFVYASNPPDGPATTPSVFFTILLLLPREDSAWQIAFHRFCRSFYRNWSRSRSDIIYGLKLRILGPQNEAALESSCLESSRNGAGTQLDRYLIKAALRIEVANEATTQLPDGRPPRRWPNQSIQSRLFLGATWDNGRFRNFVVYA